MAIFPIQSLASTLSSVFFGCLLTSVPLIGETLNTASAQSEVGNYSGGAVYEPFKFPPYVPADIDLVVQRDGSAGKVTKIAFATPHYSGAGRHIPRPPRPGPHVDPWQRRPGPLDISRPPRRGSGDIVPSGHEQPDGLEYLGRRGSSSREYARRDAGLDYVDPETGDKREADPNRAKVSRLPPTERALLDRFLEIRGITVDNDSRAAHYHEWDKVMNERISGNLRRMASAARVPSQPVAVLNVQGFDAHEALYRREAFNLLQAKHPSLNRIGMDRMTFDATTLSELLRMMTRLQLPIPGGIPDVLFALPPSAAVMEMQAAWAPAARPIVIEHGDPNRLLQGYQNKTLVIIGHISGERKDTLTALTSGGTEVAFSVAELQELAPKYNVLLLPIGCESAHSAAVGYTKQISSDKVSLFLNKLQGQRETVGDLFSAMREIGEVQVNGAKTDNMLQVVVRAAKVQKDAEAAAKMTNEEVIGGLVTTGEILGALGASLADAASTLAQELNELADDARPWYDRGPLRWIWRMYREKPWSTLFLSAATFICGGLGAARLGYRLDQPAAKARPLPYRVALGLFALGATLLVWSAALVAVESVLVAVGYFVSLGWAAYKVNEPVKRLVASAQMIKGHA